jgi:hypothetical protein
MIIAAHRYLKEENKRILESGLETEQGFKIIYNFCYENAQTLLDLVNLEIKMEAESEPAN